MICLLHDTPEHDLTHESLKAIMDAGARTCLVGGYGGARVRVVVCENHPDAPKESNGVLWARFATTNWFNKPYVATFWEGK